MSIDNKSRQAAFRQRMRLAGKKPITLWVSVEEERAIRAILDKSAVDQANLKVPAANVDEKLPDPLEPTRRRSKRTRENS